MINSNNQGLMTIPGFRWCQIITGIRFVLPVLFHMLEFSMVGMVSSTKVPLEPDLPSTVFVIVISGAFLALPYITPEGYRPNNRYVMGVMDVIQQIILVDLAFRFVVVPYFYILHYLCINGYVAFFVNKFLFLLYAVDGKVPVSKFVRMSRTEEGFEHTRYLICYLQIVFGLYLWNFHQTVIKGLIKVKNIINNLLVPLFKKKPNNKSKRSRSRSRSRS